MTNTALLQVLCLGTPNGPADLDDYPAGLYGSPPGALPDPFGYGNRMCGSFVANKVYLAGQLILPFDQIGFPGNWPQNVDSSWLATSPLPGDIAIVPAMEAIPHGHAMYVSAVSPAGTLITKSYNTGDLGAFQLAEWGMAGAVGLDTFTMAFIRFPPLG